MPRTTPRAQPAPPSRRAPAAPADGPWPALLERLPEYEPDRPLLTLEFFKESAESAGPPETVATSCQ
jgi:hypothetical protein